MQTALWIAGIAAGLLIIDRLCLWMEAKGWIYWRKTKRRPGGAGDILTGFGFGDPTMKYLHEARQERAEDDDGQPDDDTKRKPEDRIS